MRFQLRTPGRFSGFAKPDLDHVEDQTELRRAKRAHCRERRCPKQSAHHVLRGLASERATAKDPFSSICLFVHPKRVGMKWVWNGQKEYRS